MSNSWDLDKVNKFIFQNWTIEEIMIHTPIFILIFLEIFRETKIYLVIRSHSELCDPFILHKSVFYDIQTHGKNIICFGQ